MSSAAGPRVVLERILPASPAEVFAAWTDPETLRVFMRPMDVVATVVEADVRVGGRFRIVMRDGARDIELTGEYRVVEPPTRLEFTWLSPVTGPGGSLVSIALSPHDDGTRLVLTQEGLPDDDAAGRHRRGWSSILDKLARHLVAPAAHFTHREHYGVPAHAVYAALATAAGLRSWWTPDCDVAEFVGGRSVFRFGQTHSEMVIVGLTPAQEVRWRCVRQYHDAPGQLGRTNEWEGTTLVFGISDAPGGGTDLVFEHRGLVPALECYALCENRWRHYLGRSLKRYLETGTGEPFTPNE